MNVVNGSSSYTISSDMHIIKFRIRVPENIQLNNFKLSPMFQIGGTQPTVWTPYSNICPITGWTGANIYVSPTDDPADGRTYSVAFPTEAGTVYGGTLDVTSGVLTVDRAMVDLGTRNYNRVSGSDGTFVFTSGGFAGKKTGIANIISDCLLTTTITTWTNPKPNNSICGSATSTTVVIRADNYENANDLKTALNGHHAVYELANPVTYQLTPQQIITLLGTNNIWADAGDITIKYLAKK